jgi:conserved domain protein
MLNLTTKAYIKATEAVRNFKNNEDGVTAIEYGLIAVAVAVLIIAAFYTDGSFVKNLQSKFSVLASKVASTSL